MKSEELSLKLCPCLVPAFIPPIHQPKWEVYELISAYFWNLGSWVIWIFSYTYLDHADFYKAMALLV